MSATRMDKPPHQQPQCSRPTGQPWATPTGQLWATPMVVILRPTCRVRCARGADATTPRRSPASSPSPAITHSRDRQAAVGWRVPVIPVCLSRDLLVAGRMSAPEHCRRHPRPARHRDVPPQIHISNPSAASSDAPSPDRHHCLPMLTCPSSSTPKLPAPPVPEFPETLERAGPDAMHLRRATGANPSATARSKEARRV